MPRVLIIDDDAGARAYVREVAPPDWNILEAADALTGLELVRHWLPALDLVILDMHLPDVDGRWVCAQIREQSRTIPILPFTGVARSVPLLDELACLPSLLKPVRPTQLAHALRSALDQPAATLVAHPALDFVREYSYQVVDDARKMWGGRRVAIMTSVEATRTWVAQQLWAHTPLVEVDNPAALRRLLTVVQVTAVIGDASEYGALGPVARAYNKPLILIASTPIQALALRSASVSRVVLTSDSAVGAQLRGAVDTLVNGEELDDWSISEKPQAVEK